MENQKIAECVQAFGSAASIGLLDPCCKIFQAENINGMIGYRLGFGCIVIIGDPVCAIEDTPRLIQAFKEHFSKQKDKIIFAMASEDFKNWALQNGCTAHITIGNEIILDPRTEIKQGSIARLLRKKLNHSTQEGVTVHEFLADNQELKNEMEDVAKSWIKKRRGVQIYLSHIDLFTHPFGKRWFYAKQNNRIVGVVLLNKLNAYNGWVLNLSMTIPDAPNGTSELLVMTVIESLKEDGYTYLTTGTVPGAQLKIEGLNSFSMWLARNIYTIAKSIFNLAGRDTYWEKFQPQKKQSYLIFSSPKVTIAKALAIMNAFNVIPGKLKSGN